jgi:O-methyltransferase
MEKAGSTNFKIIKGWFENTLPENEMNEPIIILRLDGDWYSSTIECLEHLYPKVIDGGLIIVDDYYFWDGCSKAVHDFFSKYKLPYKIRHTENEICYIIKKNY